MSGLILITRPHEDAQKLSNLLEARNHPTFIEPMLEVRLLAVRFPTEQPQAVLVSSRHAIPALKEAKLLHALPFYAVGEATEHALRALGCHHVHSAHGMERLLPRLAALSPADGELLYVRGREVSMDVVAALPGLNVKEIIAYETVAASALSPALRKHFAAGNIRVATFLSVRTAEAFVRIAAGVPLAHTQAVAFSAPIAQVLSGLPWRGVNICATPTLEALAQAVDKARAAG